MSGFFNPANPRFRRGVVLVSISACTLATIQIVLADFGSQVYSILLYYSFLFLLRFIFIHPFIVTITIRSIFYHQYNEC